MATSSFEKDKFIVTDPGTAQKLRKHIFRTKSGNELNNRRSDFDETINELSRGKELLKRL